VSSDSILNVTSVSARDAHGDRQPDFAINVHADHALTATDFVL